MRYLIAAGTRHYVEEPELPLVHEDVEGVVGLFASMGYQRVLASVSHDPASADFEDALSDWCRSPGLTADDVLVVYYAGHGSRSATNQYRLACADSTHGRPRSWLSLPNLAEVVAESPLRNVLFIIDACHAAAAGAGLGAVTDTVVAGRGRGDELGSGTWLLASARHRDTAVDGAFVSELAKAYRQGDGASQRHLSPGTVADRVNQSFVASGLRQRAACSSVDQSEPPPFFPNPLFDPQAEVTGEGCTDAGSADLASHFEPRGRGVEQVYDSGSYFTGRERALRRGRDHLAGEEGPGILVVTADPGSGKSAVLGRLVLEGCADASVNAHHQTMEALVERLAAAADVRAATPVALFAALAGRQRPFRVIVDSLDEAGPGGDKAEARRIAWELLRPLAGVACVRLVVGSRRELLSHIGDRVPVIDLDDRAYADDTDTAEYVAKIISDAGAPYEHTPDLARRVADEVARRAGRCFLVARMTASALLRDRPVDTFVPGWTEQLPSDVGGAFEAYLQRLPSDRHEPTMALLTALAFGEGSGLPRRIWVQAARSLSGMPLTEAHIDVLLEEDGSYLSHAVVDGTRYFRLYHQELTDHMKTRVLARRDLKDVQECFVDTLTGLVPDRAWSRAHPYVLAHLATHAAESGALDDLLADASFVVGAEPSTLLPALRHALRDPMLSMAVERYCYLLTDGASAAVDRAALLAYVAGTHGEHGLARQAEELSGSLRRIRVEPREITPHRVVGRHEGDAYSIRSVSLAWTVRDLVLPAGGRAVLASEPSVPHVHVWMLDEPSRSTILPHPANVLGLAVLTDRAGRTEAVTLDARGTIRVWNVPDQTLSRAIPDTGYYELLDAGLRSDGTPVAVCRDTEHVVALSLPQWRELVRVDCPTPPQVTFDAPRASARLGHDADGRLCLLTCDGVRGRLLLHRLEEPHDPSVVREGMAQPLVVDSIHRTGGTVAAIVESRVAMSLFDMGTGKITTVPFDGFSWQEARFAHGSATDAVLVAQDDENLLILRPDAPPRRLAARGKPAAHASRMEPVLRSDGQVVAVTVSYRSQLTVVDCGTGEAVGSPVYGHESAVCALLLLDVPGAEGPDVLAVGNDGTARLWPWGAHERALPSTGQDPAGPLVSAPEVDSLIPWSQDPSAVTVVSHQLARHMRADRLDDPLLDVGPCPGLVLGDTPAEEDRSEDPDGTLNLLSWEYTGHVDAEVVGPDAEGWPLSLPMSFCIWHRLRRGSETENGGLAWFHGERGRLRGQLLPSTRWNAGTRFVGFDAVSGRVALLSAPDDAPEWVALPWIIDPGNDAVVSTAFTTTSGAPVLLTAVRPAHEHESSVAGRWIRPPGAADLVETWAEGPVVGRMWNIPTGTPFQDDGIELASDVFRLVPHHGSAGTRWIAEQGFGGTTSVIDLTTNRRYVVTLPPRAGSSGHRGRRTLFSGYSRDLCWAELPDGTPLLLHLDTAAPGESGAFPVAVWNCATPDIARCLPVPAFRILWTGPAPNGEALVAVSDEHGVALCHLPSCEKVWSAPLPALVTSLTALPGSPCLDLAVGTQQGVVFLRPQLSADWCRRLGVD
ncbi:caspase family protein [Kitasatospora sp. NPDC101235]|uniref:caspase family protein n=1 Tax=Kitasatospora sp. NPDC101235 TaxID=3364101 RepID=UPI0037FB6BD8